MELKESQFFDMAATIASGVMANPSSWNLAQDPYGQQLVITNTMNALQQAIQQAGCPIVPDDAP